MWHAMFVEQIPVAEKILRTVIVYAFIALLFRVTGKRGLASLNTFDIIVIFLLSNVVQNAVIGNDTSLIGGMIGAVTLVAVNTGVNRLIALAIPQRRPLRRIGEFRVSCEPATSESARIQARVPRRKSLGSARANGG
jgi:hypothetical protein